jgi:prevent-host-death family protein
MDVLGFADARARLGEVMKAVVADHNPVAIARRKGGAVVLVSLGDDEAQEDAIRRLSTLGAAE